MSEHSARLLDQAMQLPPEERAELADRLSSSLGPPVDEGVAASHLKEVEARLDALERGEMKAIPAKEAFEIARRALAHPRADIQERFLDALRQAVAECCLLPPGFYDSFRFTRTGENYTHPRTLGLIVKALWALPEVEAVDVDVRFNAGQGCKFQPDAAARNAADQVVLVVDYESPNSSDARIPKKDVKAYVAWATHELNQHGTQPPPYLIVTTLPHRPAQGEWWLRWTAQGQYNDGRTKDRQAIAESPLHYWYRFYREEVPKLLEGELQASVRFLNFDGKHVGFETVP